MTDIRFYPYQVFPPDLNMAIDEYFLLHGEGISVRLYGWEPGAVSLGHSQESEQAVDLDACRRHGIPIVRRSTGGAAVLHWQDITYMVSAPLSCFQDRSVVGVYREIATLLRETFIRLGLDCRFAGQVHAAERRKGMQSGVACFLLPSDYELIINGCKLVGSAQRRDVRRMMQHGSIAWQFDFPLTAEILRAPLPVLEQKVTSMERIKPGITVEDLTQALLETLPCNGHAVHKAPPVLEEIDGEKVFELRNSFPLQ